MYESQHKNTSMKKQNKPEQTHFLQTDQHNSNGSQKNDMSKIPGNKSKRTVLSTFKVTRAHTQINWINSARIQTAEPNKR